ncbi:MAG: aminopeptidase P family protein [Tissierellia bacterium]|nr:aminopeptidase P family protein [Tissierellia bacterium]
MKTNDKIKKLRKKMKENGVNCYIVNTADPHMSEYLHEYYQTRAFLTGFTGSQGTALVSMDKALLWADGRYFIQAENQIMDSEFSLMKMMTPGFPSLEEWLKENLKDGTTLAFDGKNYSEEGFERIESLFKGKNIKIKTDFDFMTEIWEDRPSPPFGETFVLEEKYAGKSVKDKLTEVRERLKKDGASHFVIGSLDDIAWLFNIRGRDVKNNPVIISYALVSMDVAVLYVDPKKLTDEVVKHLKDSGVKTKGYTKIFDDVKKLGKKDKVQLDKSRINHNLYSSIPSDVKIIPKTDITTILKANKNKTEIENQKIAYIKDGVALTKFFKWLEENLSSGKVTEKVASEKLLEFRKEGDLFIEDSFDTISAYGPNAAMMHYSPDTGNNATLQEKSYYLVDSGGQYFNGTTDITRTVALGELTQEEKEDYTLTLKGLIDLTMTKFLKGTTGEQLDIISRRPLWQRGVDYKCGTGHGIGFLLNVHEGPHRIANVVRNPVAFEIGMVTSIEPGVYKEGKHGIRIENVVAVKKEVETESGEFYAFDTLTMVYIDTKPIIKELMDEESIEWLNNYHKEVYEKLSPYLNDDEKAFLKEKTTEI